MKAFKQLQEHGPGSNQSHKDNLCTDAEAFLMSLSYATSSNIGLIKNLKTTLTFKTASTVGGETKNENHTLSE